MTEEDDPKLLSALVSPQQIQHLIRTTSNTLVKVDSADNEESDHAECYHEPSNFKIKPISDTSIEARRRVTIANDLPTLKTSMEGRHHRRSRYSTFIAGINQFDPYQELTSTQIAAFRQVFDMVDRDGGGSIDAEELYTSMKDLESGLKLDEITEILNELDRDGNGEIDFEEFLYMMTSMSIQIKEAQEDNALFKQGKRRQSIFFSVITKFAMKHSLKEIERYYASKAKRSPHVVGHYAAGARVFGLTDKELRKTWKEFSHASKGKDSPYAQPLNFVVDHDNGKCKKKTINPLRRNKSKSPTRSASSPTRVASFPARPTSSSSDPPKELKNKFKFTLKKAVATTDETTKDNKIEKTDELSPTPRKVSVAPESSGRKLSIGNSAHEGRRQSASSNSNIATSETSASRCASPTIPQEKVDGWTPRHRLPVTKVKLPKFTYTQPKKLTIKDMDKIRKRVIDARNIYYNHLSEERINKAKECWKSLKTEQIPSERLQTNFKKVFRCYSPTNKDKELRTPTSSRSKSPASDFGMYRNDGEFPDFVF